MLMKGIGKYIFPGLGIIPVDRSTNGKQAVVTAEEYLNDGKLVAIFPEGTTNKTDDIMMPFKGGAVKIASDTGCDIVPFVISGKYKYFKKSIKIKFMPVMKVERGSLKAANKNLYETVRNELEKEYGVEKRRIPRTESSATSCLCLSSTSFLSSILIRKHTARRTFLPTAQ